MRNCHCPILLGAALLSACVTESGDDAEETAQAEAPACPAIFAPVCGDDGETHSNSCLAQGAGVNVLFIGFCGDFNGDSCVDFVDFQILSSHFGMAGGHGDGDATGDAIVDFPDFLILSHEYGQGLTCP